MDLLSSHPDGAFIAHGETAKAAVGNGNSVGLAIADIARVGGHRDGATGHEGRRLVDGERDSLGLGDRDSRGESEEAAGDEGDEVLSELHVEDLI